MSDNELLELAAEAAGIDHLGFHADGLVYAHNWDCSDRYEWNPLTDDGDALRLLAKLRIDLCRPYKNYGAVCAWVDHLSEYMEEPEGEDPAAATRRIIVRVAAEIGKALP